VRPLRPGRDSDDFAALVAACWGEHPDIVIDIEAEAPELHRLASHMADLGGALWAADGERGLAGMIGASPHGPDEWEIVRLYVSAAERGGGLAHRLLDVAEAHAEAAGARRLTLWTDTRFTRAHRFYEKRGYVRGGPDRALHDLSNSVEHHYQRQVGR
jgi:GNAT superfamily N-acetyltransferase